MSDPSKRDDKIVLGAPRSPLKVAEAALELPLTCPECRGSLHVEGISTMARCPSCNKTIRCLACPKCSHCYCTVKTRRMQCPRCLSTTPDARTSAVPFSSLTTQPDSAATPLDPEIVASSSPGLHDIPRRRFSRRQIIGVGVVVLAIIVGGVIAKATSHGTTPTATPPPSAVTVTPTQLSASCPAKAAISFTSAQNNADDFIVSATGSLRNAGTQALKDVKVSWVVTYADLSTGNPTTTLLSGGQTLAKGATLSWSGTAAGNDGQVPPTGARVVHLAFNNGASC